jgi:hypothetical protein
MDTPPNQADARAGTVEDWATGSLRAARVASRDPVTCRPITPGQKLAGVYQEATLPVVRGRL